MMSVQVGDSVFSVARYDDDRVIVWNAWEKGDGARAKVFKVREFMGKRAGVTAKVSRKWFICTGGVKGFLGMAWMGGKVAKEIALMLHWAWFNAEWELPEKEM